MPPGSGRPCRVVRAAPGEPGRHKHQQAVDHTRTAQPLAPLEVLHQQRTGNLRQQGKLADRAKSPMMKPDAPSASSSIWNGMLRMTTKKTIPSELAVTLSRRPRRSARRRWRRRAVRRSCGSSSQHRGQRRPQFASGSRARKAARRSRWRARTACRRGASCRIRRGSRRSAESRGVEQGARAREGLRHGGRTPRQDGHVVQHGLDQRRAEPSCSLRHRKAWAVA